MPASHAHDCPGCGGYWPCEEDDCTERDLCSECRGDAWSCTECGKDADGCYCDEDAEPKVLS